MIRPYDKEQLKDISAAIAASNLGVNPQHNPDHLRIIFAPITEETRIASVKKAKTILEDAKIRIRRVRQDVQTLIKKTTGLSEDTIRHFDEELNKTTKEWNNKLEGLFAKKEAELMKI
jgi:ribosome recycling factor